MTLARASSRVTRLCGPRVRGAAPGKGSMAKSKHTTPRAAPARPQTPGKPRKPEGYRASGPKGLPARLLFRWAPVLLVMTVLLLIYQFHPYYGRSMFTGKNWAALFRSAWLLWLLAGIPYVYFTLEKFGGRRMDLTDGAMHWALLFRGVWSWLFEGCRWPRHVWKNRRMRTSVLSLAVKAFFTPLMWVFLSDHANNMRNMWLKHKNIELLTDAEIISINAKPFRDMAQAWWEYFLGIWPRLQPTWDGFVDGLSVWRFTSDDTRWSLDFYYQLLFFVDCLWAFTGYAGESRWLDNKTKSVEPTGFGWMVALMCYPPFNDLSGTYFPLGKSDVLFSNPDTLLVFKALTLVAFTVYVWATLAFGPRFSNLTHRGIVQRGPYAFIRHPAYAAKNFAWWMEHLPYAGSANGFLGVNWANLAWLACWNIIYALRAWTEERHLSRDPVYVEYKKKVRWAAIPGWF